MHIFRVSVLPVKKSIQQLSIRDPVLVPQASLYPSCMHADLDKGKYHPRFQASGSYGMEC